MTSRSQITSTKNQRIKWVGSLRHKRERDHQRLFIVEGYREIERVCEAKFEVHTVFLCEAFFPGVDAQRLAAKLERQIGDRCYRTTEVVFDQLSMRQHPDGMLAVANQSDIELNNLEVDENGFYLVVESVEKPGNLGAMFRSADAVNCNGLIVCDQVTDVFNPNVVRASIGTIFSVPFAVSSTPRCIEWLAQNHLRTVVTSPAAAQNYKDAALGNGVAIVIGSEKDGLSQRWLDAADEVVKLPSLGQADSVNAAMAATVMLFEAWARRGV